VTGKAPPDYPDDCDQCEKERADEDFAARFKDETDDLHDEGDAAADCPESEHDSCDNSKDLFLSLGWLLTGEHSLSPND
jgi:hypothetical protein